MLETTDVALSLQNLANFISIQAWLQGNQSGLLHLCLLGLLMMLITRLWQRPSGNGSSDAPSLCASCDAASDSSCYDDVICCTLFNAS